ncbi:methyltransferase domain-containing protein [Mycoplasmatota bacterium]|nr:methyltransferase domain-containing protein [Mycoplasmatota bacterium]
MGSPWKHEKFTNISLEHIDRKFAPNTTQQVSFLLDKMKLKRDDRILDLGCGAGRHAIEFSKNGIDVTGIDISPTMIQNAIIRSKKENLNIKYIECDLANLSKLNFKNNSFNGAICLCEAGIGVIGGSQQDYNFFSTVYNLLSPNSLFVISSFNSIRRYIKSKDTNPRFDYINSTMNWDANIDGENLSEEQRQYTPSEIKMLLLLCGFKNIKILSCANGIFSDSPMGIEDIEMLVLAEKDNT